MFFLNVRLALVILLIVPCIAVLTVYFQNKILHWNRKVRKINAQITSAYNEGITGVKTSKSMGIEEDNEKAFFERTSQMHQAASRSAKLNAIYVPAILLFGSVAAAVVLARGGAMVKEDIIRLGTLSVFISYAVIIFEPIQQLARLLAELISCQANIERVMDLLEQEPNVVDREDVLLRYGDAFHPKKENWEKIEGDIVFEDVSFRYPDGKEFVLEHFNLHVPAGMNVAIVGETGAGKSTLVNLVGRFFEPTSGRILIDGTDISNVTIHSLRAQMGVMMQDSFIFAGTIMDNIRYGNHTATDEDVIRAAKTVCAHDFIMELENGYQTEVNERGSRLSAGQRQLISFARALLADPKILILDEATSSIDTETEIALQKGLSELLKGRTSFIIAHRLSTIRNADCIMYVDRGNILEKGTHEELMALGGEYYRLYMSQYLNCA